MKVNVPENIKDITLEQFQRFEKLDSEADNYQQKKIALFSSIPYHKIKDLTKKDFDSLSIMIDEALNKDADFTDRFTMNGVEYGFIPNFDEIAGSEWVDLNKYGVEVETLHNLMAILFRPVIKSSLGNYEIETYNGTKHTADTMKQTPMNIVNGALVFFYHLSSELENYILRFTQEEQARGKAQKTILKSGDGTQLSTT